MKVIQLIGILFLFMLGYGNSYGQVIDRTYAIPGSQDAPNVSGCNLTNDEGLVIAGFETNARGFLMKVDSIGDLIWRRTFIGKHILGDPEPTSDGGFIVQTRGFNTNNLMLTGDFLLTKFDSLGNIEYEIVDSLLHLWGNYNHSTSKHYERGNKISTSFIYNGLGINGNVSIINQTNEYDNISGILTNTFFDTVVTTYPSNGYNFVYNKNSLEFSWQMKETRVLLDEGKVASLVNFDLYQNQQSVLVDVPNNMGFCIVDSFGQIEIFKNLDYINWVGEANAYGIVGTADLGFIIAGSSAQGDFLMEDKIRNKRQILSISDHKGLLLVTVERDGEIIHTQKLIRL